MRTASVLRRVSVVLLLVLLLQLGATATASACDGRPIYYVIRCGDTLSAIAWRYGVSVTYLARINGIPNPNRIYAGTTIVIHPGCDCPRYRVYVVQPGDTLLRIARWYGVSAWRIAEANGIYNLNRIWVGQRLIIPW